MEVNEAQRLRSLEDENSRLKRLEEMRGGDAGTDGATTIEKLLRMQN
jgi:hypothetical protein